jgi:hypothetical protein
MRVNAERACRASCTDAARVELLSTLAGTGARPLPVIEALEFTPGGLPVSKVIELPIYGDAMRYPFDTWTLTILVTPFQTSADQGGQITLSAENRVPRLQLQRQAIVGSQAGAGGVSGGPSTVQVNLEFQRPPYLKIISVLLVLLVAAAAAYAVFLRPLSELIINAGALVLGVWGIRAVMLGTELTFMTGVDLALMGIILFLLVTLTLRTLWSLERRSQLQPLHAVAHRRQRRDVQIGEPPSTRASPSDPEPYSRPEHARRKDGNPN